MSVYNYQIYIFYILIYIIYIYLREIKDSPNLLENVKMYTFPLLKKVFLKFFKEKI